MKNTDFTKLEMIKLQNSLRAAKKTITTAESCTGGLVASMITKMPGSSDIFNGSIVTYSNKIKNQELNVKKETLEKYGAVSVQVVEEMLDGVMKKFDSNFAIAISGIAGPGGGSELKPVGTVVIGVCDDEKFKNVEVFMFEGDRQSVQKQAAKASFLQILKFFSKTLDI